jgi:2-polyprenyl-3-methyl-5-hydroxy-6-metoxy-1,4-benzoquinol methylase
MNYGVDVGATRLDDLDRRVVAQVEELVQTQSIVSVLDVGCGAGGLAVTLAKAGAMVTAVDVGDYTKEIVKRQQEVGVKLKAVSFTQADVRTWLPLQTTMYDMVVLQ